MKKYIILLILIACGLVYGVTARYQAGESAPSVFGSDVMYAYVYETDGDVNDFSQALSLGNCTLERIVVDANGTDTSFKLYIYETGTTYNDVTAWSKTDFTTASVPYTLALYTSDGTGNQFGIPTDGRLQLTLADGDDATMDAIEIYLYYRTRKR
jgi:hypothetical protein